MTLTVQNPKDLVYSNFDNEPVTNSLILAKDFDRRHWDVFKTIHKKIRNYSKEFEKRNFSLSEYRDEAGKMNRMYELTKDGFWAIVLGFTGSKAAQMQELSPNQSLKRFFPKDQKAYENPWLFHLNDE